MKIINKEHVALISGGDLSPSSFCIEHKNGKTKEVVYVDKFNLTEKEQKKTDQLMKLADNSKNWDSCLGGEV